MTWKLLDVNSKCVFSPKFCREVNFICTCHTKKPAQILHNDIHFACIHRGYICYYRDDIQRDKVHHILVSGESRGDTDDMSMMRRSLSQK